MGDELDRWAEWVLHRRDGDDVEQQRRTLEYLLPIRQRMLDNARIEVGDTVLDVGAGDGLIAFGAVERVGRDGHVIVSDISTDLLAHAARTATDVGLKARMSFVRTRAEDLAGIADDSTDVVTTRSVLIYVDDKRAAFRAFHRVLRPGGRISLFEPINRYFPETPDSFWDFDARPVRDLVAKVWEYEGWVETNYDSDPMMNFTERELLEHAEAAGFDEVHVELVIDVEPGSWVVGWDALLGSSPNPNAQTAGEALQGALTPHEFERFEEYMRPVADAGQGVKRDASAYLVAVKR